MFFFFLDCPFFSFFFNGLNQFFLFTFSWFFDEQRLTSDYFFFENNAPMMRPSFFFFWMTHFFWKKKMGWFFLCPFSAHVFFFRPSSGFPYWNLSTCRTRVLQLCRISSAPKFREESNLLWDSPSPIPPLSPSSSHLSSNPIYLVLSWKSSHFFNLVSWF